MLIQQKKGTLHNPAQSRKTLDWLVLHWHEANKRILRKNTKAGVEILFKSLDKNPALTQNDILFEDDRSIIAVEIMPCECLIIKPANMYEMASVCYEIGNKHLPLFFENETLLIPFEEPLYKLLAAQGYTITREEKKLLQSLNTTVAPHNSGQTLFSKIMKLTAPNV